MAETPAVRRVRLSDAARVRSIRLEALADPVADIAYLETRAQAEARPDEYWQERTAGAALSGSAAQFIAEAGRDWVGTVTVLIPEVGSEDYFGRVAVEGRALVVAVYVRASHRGRGTLDALMDAAAEWATASGQSEIALDVHEDNARAQRAYARLGFTATGVTSDGPNGAELEMVRVAVTATAEDVRAALEAEASVDQRDKIRKRMTDESIRVIGVRMGTVFAIAKANTGMPLTEVDRLLDSDTYEERMVAVSILDFKARAKNADRAALYDLWMRRLDRIDTWDYIDRSAPRVVGGYLLDKPRDVLFELARSDNRWHRRTAITAAFWIIRSGDLDDPLALCEILAADPEHLVQTNVGVALREIGRVDRERLEEFLARRSADLSAHARRTARTAL